MITKKEDLEWKMFNYLSPAAMYEGLAEEAVELAHAAQKLARYLRAESPVEHDITELIFHLVEEWTHLNLYASEVELYSNNVIATEVKDRFIKRMLSKGDTPNASN